MSTELHSHYLTRQLQAFLAPHIPLNIYHSPSEASAGVQAADLLCWGIFRKYERSDEEWCRVFQRFWPSTFLLIADERAREFVNRALDEREAYWRRPDFPDRSSWMCPFKKDRNVLICPP